MSSFEDIVKELLLEKRPELKEDVQGKSLEELTKLCIVHLTHEELHKMQMDVAEALWDIDQDVPEEGDSEPVEPVSRDSLISANDLDYPTP